MASKPTEKVSFLKNLLERRVPQLMGIYIGGCWGVFQFVQYLVARHGLSPNLEDLFLILSASLIPSVVLLVYFHGRPGRDRWVKFELIGVPVNLVAAAALLIFLFQGKSLGATTEKISVRNEDGKKVEKRVAKREFRERIALFPFAYQSGDPRFKWLSLGLPLTLAVDLDQDLFLSVANPFSNRMLEDLKQTKANLDGSLPLTLCRRIAENNHIPFFLMGTVDVRDNQFFLSSRLYETKRGREMYRRELNGAQFFPLVDEMTRQLKTDLQIPTVQLESVQDLPVEEILTGSLESLEWLVKGLRVYSYEGDVKLALTHLQKSIEKDPSHALAHLHLAGIQINANQADEARETLLAAANLDYKLTDSSRFELKDMSFILNGQGEKRLALLKMQTELYPDSIGAHVSLGDLYLRLNLFEEALQTFQTVSSMASQPEIYHPRIAWTLERLGRLNDALTYHKGYMSAFPEDADGVVRLANFHFRAGDFEKAARLFEKAALIDPDPSIQLGSARTDIRQGHFPKAKLVLEELLTKTQGRDRLEIYESLEELYQIQGKLAQMGQIVRLKLEEAAEILTPINLSFYYINNARQLIFTGEPQKAFELLAQVDTEMKGSFQATSHFGYVIAYLELEDAPKAREHLQDLKIHLDALAKVFSGVSSFIPYAEGKILEIEGRYEEAFVFFRKNAAAATFDAQSQYLEGKCLRMMGRWQEAKASLSKALALFPSMAILHDEMARIFEGLGQIKQAQTHLKKALDIWGEADPGFKPALEAQTLMENLSNRL